MQVIHKEGEKMFICHASDKPKKVRLFGPHVFLINEVKKFIAQSRPGW